MNETTPAVPAAPVQPAVVTAPTLPPWAKEAIRIGVYLLIAILAAKYGVIVPAQPVPVQTPAPIVVQSAPAPCTCAK